MTFLDANKTSVQGTQTQTSETSQASDVKVEKLDVPKLMQIALDVTIRKHSGIPLENRETVIRELGDLPQPLEKALVDRIFKSRLDAAAGNIDQLVKVLQEIKSYCEVVKEGSKEFSSEIFEDFFVTILEEVSIKLEKRPVLKGVLPKGHRLPKVISHIVFRNKYIEFKDDEPMQRMMGLFWGNRIMPLKEVTGFSDFFKNHPYVRTLVLTCEINQEIIDELAEGLESVNDSLETLAFDRNKVSSDIRFQKFGEFLRDDHSIERLVISTNYLNGSQVLDIAEAIKHNDTLQELNILLNDIRDEGARALAAALQENTTLKILNVGTNHISANVLNTLKATEKLVEGRRIIF